MHIAIDMPDSFEVVPRTMVLAPHRIVFMGCKDTGLRIHVTPMSTHVVDLDCDGVCLVCNEVLEG